MSAVDLLSRGSQLTKCLDVQEFTDSVHRSKQVAHGPVASVDLVPYIESVVSVVAEDKGMFMSSKHISTGDKQHSCITHV